MARKINDYLSTFFPAEALNEANQQARFQYDYPNLSQQMTHNQYAAPYQQFQQEYPQLEQYARDVLSGRVAKRGLQELSSNLNQAIQGNPQALEPYIGFGGMTAFHGSPHKFGKFLMDKIGTGEGAQAYGHGLYFAENPTVAKGYQGRLADMNYHATPSDYVLQNNSPLMEETAQYYLNHYASQGVRQSDAIGEANSLVTYIGTSNDSIKQIAKEWDIPEEFVTKIRKELEGYSFSGHLYEVDIPDEQINKMLDWDAPDWTQPKEAQKLGKELGLEEWYGMDLLHELRKKYRTAGALNPDEMASKELKSLGIPGIKYFDQESRSAGEGTRNFVVFDEDLVKILDRK